MDGNISTIIVVAVIAVICVYSVISYRKKLSEGCCGSFGPAVKKMRVNDRNLSHYPYEVTMRIDGMVCAKCKTRVENALNSIDGVWAIADAEKGEVVVRMKNAVEPGVLRETVKSCGYIAY